MNTIISDAKAEFLRAKGRLEIDINNTPDDKVGWTPSATARTPIQIVAHGAMGTQSLNEWLAGKPFPFANMTEMDAAFRLAEKEYKTREAALNLLEQTTSEYVSWLESLTPEQVGSTVEMPFGAVPMAVAITFAADHLRGHACQLEYIQTIYGDYSIRA
jgi:hypothetical protein